MSQLPKGTKAARGYLERVIGAGIEAQATALLPAVAAIPVIGKIYISFVKWVIEKFVVNESLDETTAYGLAAKYAVDRIAFDKDFLTMELMDIQNSTPEQIEEALKNAEKSIYNLVRRGPVS